MSAAFPACACGGELAPPVRVWFPHAPDDSRTARVVPDVTEAEEAEANAYEDAAIVQCRKCGTRVVLHAERPERFRKNQPKADQSVFNVTNKEQTT